MKKTKTVIRERISYWEGVLKEAQEAYIALIEKGVKSYTIADRTLTRLDIGQLEKVMENAEEKIDELEAALEDRRPRKTVGVVPRDF